MEYFRARLGGLRIFPGLANREGFQGGARNGQKTVPKGDPKGDPKSAPFGRRKSFIKSCFLMFSQLSAPGKDPKFVPQNGPKHAKSLAENS